MDQDISLSLINFSTVWERVTGVANSPHGAAYEVKLDATASLVPGNNADSEALRPLIDGAYSRAMAYARLSKARPDLRGLADGEWRRVSALSFEDFMLTGERYVPAILRGEIPAGILETARYIYLEEKKAAAEFTEAARNTQSKRLASLFTEFSQQSMEHVEVLRSFIGRIFGTK